MLKEIGIPAWMVLVRTNLQGNFEITPPSHAIFDHAITYIPSLHLYLDGTAAPAPPRGRAALSRPPYDPLAQRCATENRSALDLGHPPFLL